MTPHLWQGMRAAVGAVNLTGIARQARGVVLLAAVTLGGTIPGAALAQAGPESFAELAEAKLPAVVNVSATQSPDAAERGSGMPPGLPQFPPGSPFEEFFREFFGDRFGQRQGPEQGPGPMPPFGDLTAVGSGFIIDPEGYVVTNNHVVANAETVVVTLQDETELTAEIVGRDPRTDLALLKVESDDPLPAVEWGDSDAIQVGDWVMAVGNPFGLGGSVTTGIISARARDINAGPYDDFLQTDASINQGNSGGPLFGMDGRVVGVNTAIFSPSGGNIGIGFAVPSAMAQAVIKELRETGTVRRGWLGVQIQPVTEEIAEAVGLQDEGGALVTDVLQGSPAAQAGLEAGDVILSFNDQEVQDPRVLQRIVADTPVDATVGIEVWRDGDRQTLDTRIALLEDQEQQFAETRGAQPGEAEAETDALGLSLAELSPELREEFGIAQETTGVLVLEVDQGSPAATENIAPGDVITKVGRQMVSEPDEVVAAVEEARRARQGSVLLLRERDGNPAFVALPTEPGRG